MPACIPLSLPAFLSLSLQLPPYLKPKKKKEKVHTWIFITPFKLLNTIQAILQVIGKLKKG